MKEGASVVAIVVTDISWTRTFFEVEYHTTETEFQELFLFNNELHQFVAFENEILSSCADEIVVRAKLNVVLVGGRNPLPAGQWMLCVKAREHFFHDGESLSQTHSHFANHVSENAEKRTSFAERGESIYSNTKTDGQRFAAAVNNRCEIHSINYRENVLEKLETLARVFRYSERKYIYAAWVDARVDASDQVFVVLTVDFYEHNSNPRVRKGSLRFREKQLLSLFANFKGKRFNHSGKRVLFFKENADTPTSNMAAVRDRMIERGLDKEFQIVEHYRNTFSTMRQRPSEWLSDIAEIIKADYIFVDDYCPIFGFIKPAQGAVLTQLWHAGVGFKSVGYARFGIDGSPDPYNSPHRMYDYAIVGNAHLRAVYSEVFGIEPQALLATGMPRLDHFLDRQKAQLVKEALYEQYPWMTQGRVIVFAPTYRGTGQREAYYPYHEFFDFKKLYDMCLATNSYFVFEMHGFIKEPPPIPREYQDRIFDLSHENLDELYHVSDVLVTDYSSCFYDYLLLQKPVVFYTPDRVVYSVTRGVQRPIDEFAPGVVCDTFNEFVAVLATAVYENVSPDPSCIDRAAEGGMLASDRIIDTILLGKDVPGVKLIEHT